MRILVWEWGRLSGLVLFHIIQLTIKNIDWRTSPITSMTKWEGFVRLMAELKIL